jgi:hypothetical protein
LVRCWCRAQKCTARMYMGGRVWYDVRARGIDVGVDVAAQPGRVVVSGEAVIQETWEADY